MLWLFWNYYDYIMTHHVSEFLITVEYDTIWLQIQYDMMVYLIQI